MAGFARSVIGFAATEVLLYTAGLTMLSEPGTLIMASVVAVWFWLGAWFSHESLRPLVARVSDTPELVHAPMAWILALFAALLLGVLFGPTVERRLWLSGNFGEPPFNRSICYYRNENVVELRVLHSSISDPLVAVILPRKDQIINKPELTYWFDNPGVVDGDRGGVGIISHIKSPLHMATVQFSTFPITPQQSLFLSYGKGIDALSEIYFGPTEELRNATFPIDTKDCIVKP